MKKYSRKREAILDVIRSTDTHPTVEWVYTRLKPEFPNLSLATVYRNISAFVEEGKVVSVGVVNGQERYDGNVEPHLHFVCDKCGSVIDLDQNQDADLDKKVADKFELDVSRHELTFHGRCHDCMSA